MAMQYKRLIRAASINKFAIQNYPHGVANCSLLGLSLSG